MKLGISIGVGAGRNRARPADMARYVQAAEAAGVDYAWSAEAWGRDAVTPIAYLAAVTERITLGTGIMQVPARSPAMTAMTALSLAELAGGRFVLGLGVSGPQVVEGLHGVAFDPALTRLRETVSVVRMAARGEPIELDGKVYQLPRPGGQGKRLRIDQAPRPELRVFLATLGPRALAFTGECADGWLGTSFSPDHPAAHLEHIRAGARRAGRGVDAVDLQVSATTIVTDEVDAAVAGQKPSLAFQLGAMGSATTNFYNAAFQRAGYADDALAVQRLWLDGQREAAAARVPDEMVRAFALIGTAADVRARVEDYRRAGIGCINLRFATGSVAARVEALERAVEAIRG